MTRTSGRTRALYSGHVLKSRDGIPRPIAPPPGIDMAAEARIARRRFYPVTAAYTAYAAVVMAIGLRADRGAAVVSIAVGVAAWTLVEYLVHRHILHRRFPDGPGLLARALHRVFDPAHGDHHLRPWDGRHINGRFDTVPFAAVLAMTSFLAPGPALPVFVATILQCYVVEEWVHYSVHFHQFRWSYFRYIRRHHLYHHGARGDEVAFGLTSGFWDIPFRTRIRAEERVVLRQRRRGVARGRPARGQERHELGAGMSTADRQWREPT